MPSLPVDPDPLNPDTAARPVHLRLRFILMVFAGGVVGTAVRAGLGLAFPPIHGVPFTTLAINVVGALLLGMLLETVARRGDDTGWRRAARLTVGTGVLGGFTTYSALAVDTGTLLLSGAAIPGMLYAVGTLLLGLAAATAGSALAAARARRTS